MNCGVLTGRDVWKIIGVWLLACLVFIGIRRYEEPLTYGPLGRIFADNDGSMRWLLVRRALEGEGSRIRWMREDNAPYGRMNEWTSPMTQIGAWATWGVQKALGWSLKEAWGVSGVWMGAVMGLILLTVAAWYGWRLGGWSLAACWLVAWQPLPDFFQMTRLGNPDYHSLHQVLLVVMFLSVYSARQRANELGVASGKRFLTQEGIITGIAAGFALWSSATECLPLVVLVFSLGFYDLWIAPSFRAKWPFSAIDKKVKGNAGVHTSMGRGLKRTESEKEIENPSTFQGMDGRKYFWLVCARSLVGTVLIAYLYEYWPDLWRRELELLSVWHVVAALLGWWCVEGQVRFKDNALGWVALGVSGLILVLLAGWLRDWQWGALHVAQDGFYWTHWSTAAEMQGWWTTDRGWMGLLHRVWWCYGLLPVLFLWVLWPYVRRGSLEVWACVGVGVLFFLCWHQARWGTFFVIVFVIVLGLAAQAVFYKWRGWLALGMMALCFPCWQTIATGVIENQSVRGRYVESGIMQLASRLIVKDARREGAVVVAPWHLTPRMICHGEVRTVGSAYWSNIAGLKANHEIFSTFSEERLKQLLKERTVDYLLAPPPPIMSREVIDASYALSGRRMSVEAVRGVALIQALVRQANYLELMEGGGLEWIRFQELGKGWMIYRVRRDKF